MHVAIEGISINWQGPFGTSGTEEGGDYAEYLQVPVPKASVKGKEGEPAWVEICLDKCPKDVMREILLQGAKTIINRGMTGDGFKGLKDNDLRKAALDKASENVQAMYDGKVRMSGGVRSKIAGVTKTEAMRIARALVKDAMKAHGYKVSHYKASEISEFAKAVLEGEQGPEILAQAETNLRKQEEGKTKLGIDLSQMKPDPELAAKANARKKPRKEVASPEQVMAATRARAQGAAQHGRH